MENNNRILVRRNNSLDLLRVVAMLLIIILHFQGKTGFLNSDNEFSALWFEKNIFEAFAICGVNCYVLISGYFLVDSKFSIRKCLTLWLKVIIFSLIFFILTVFFIEGLTFKRVILSIFPINTKVYWFVTIYIGMYMLSPFVNIFLSNINKKIHLSLCILMTIMFSILPSIVPYGYLDGIGFNGIDGTNITWFIYLYIMSAYIKKYINISRIYEKRYKYIFLYFVSCFSIFLTKAISCFAGNRIKMLLNLRTYYYNYATIFSLMSSLFIFLFFLGLSYKEKQNRRVLNFLAKRTFGVYLIHENDFSRYILWGSAVALLDKYINAVTYIPILLCSVLIIFLTCTFLDYVFDLLFSKMINILSEKISILFQKVLERMFRKTLATKENNHD